MVMQSMRHGKASGLIKFIFFSLLVLATGGLVLTDVGGFFRGGIQSNEVATINDEKITILEFDRKVRLITARLGMSPQQAYQLGYIRQILNNEIRTALIQQAATDYGLRVGQEQVAAAVNDMISPLVQQGQSKKDVLDQLLLSQSMSEAEFVKSVSNEVAANILAGALQNESLGQSDSLAKALYKYQNETRSIQYINFPHAEFTLDQDPDDAELKALYNELRQTFMIPEQRDIQVGIVNDDDLQASIDITEEELRNSYEDNIDAYKIPDQRVLEQVIVSSQNEAQKIYSQTQGDGGASLQSAAQNVTGDDTAFIEAQPFQKDGLLDSIQEPVFDAPANDLPILLEPIQTDLGWHVIRVTEVQPGRTQSFEEIRDDLGRELKNIALLDQKYEIAGDIDDMSAGGTPLSEIATQIPMDIQTYEDVTAMGAMASANHPLDAFGDNAQDITDKAFNLFEGEVSEVIELMDGRQVVVSVQNIQEQRYQSFEDVREALKVRWIAEKKEDLNRQAVKESFQKISMDNADINTIAQDSGKSIATLENITRTSNSEAPLTPATLEKIFISNTDEPFLAETAGGIAIMSVTDIASPSLSDDAKDDLETLQKANAQSTQNEIMTLFISALQKDADIQVNDRLLEQAYGQASTTF